MAALFDPRPVAPTSPIKWPTEDRQRRAHGLHTRSTFAKKAPKIDASCTTCGLIHRGEC